MAKKLGKFIVLEGIEGSGKTVQTKLLLEYLISKRIATYRTQEPSNGPIGKIIRSEYMSGTRKADTDVLNLLCIADRLDHITNEETGLLNFINDGICIISDRYYMSSIAYHSIPYLSNRSKYHQAIEDIMSRNEINRNALRPDVTIFIDADPEVSYDRVIKRSSKKEIFDDLHSIKKLYTTYHDAKKYLESIGDNIYTVDGNQTIDDVHNKIINDVIKPMFNL